MQNQIPKNWQKAKLGDLLKDGVILQIQDGNHGEKHPKQSDFVKNGDRVPFIMANDLNSGKIDFNNCNYISKKQADSLRIGFAKSGDVLLTHKGNLGLVSIVPEMEFDYLILTPQVTYYRVDKNRLDNHFLKYVFLNPYFQKELQNISPQSTRPYVGITAQRDLEINFIEDVQDQKKIAAILSAFDDKIEVNNNIAKTLEEMAQVLFKEWFLEFRFPWYEKVEFVNSELGKAPKDWTMGTLKQLMDVDHGFAFPSNKFYKKGDLPVIKIKNILEDKSTDLSDLDFINTKDFNKNLESFRLNNGDILIAMTGATSGKVAILIGDYKEYLLNQRVGKFKFLEDYYKWFCYIFLTRPSYRTLLLNSSDGSAQGNLSPTQIKSIKLIIPPDNILEEFDSIVNTFYIEIIKNKLENQKLAALRDLLLPKLMKGEVRV